jgi:hypothetical protein
VTDKLVFYYDINNRKKSWIGKPTTNTVNALTAGIGRYNNPGFSGGVVNTGQTFNGFPIYKTTFIAQDSSYISRLASGEGFGAYHGMGIALQANTRYMASIYFKSNYPLQNSASQGFSNGYSNIGGWNQNGTTSARYQESGGWTRLYTQYLNSTNGYSTRSSTFQTNFTVNTTTTENIDLAFTIASNGSGISDFAYLYAIVSASPSIASNGGLTGLSIVNHGLDTTSFTKLSWPSLIELKTDLPLTYYVRVSVPSTGGVNTTIALRANFGGYYTALSDSKYWKVTFDTTNLSVGTEIETFWCCPMIEQHDIVYPSTFVNGTRSNTQSILDILNTNTITANDLTYTNDGNFSFNGSSNYLSIPLTTLGAERNKFTIETWGSFSATGNSALIFNAKGQGLYPRISKTGAEIIFVQYRPAGVTTSISSSTTVSLNIPYHIVFTYDSTAGGKLYLNGLLSGSETTTLGTHEGGTSGDIVIGRDSNLSTWHNGTCYIYKMYDKVLSQSEIQQNFTALRGRFGV